jgi:flagellar hook-basal body complex protein FliE
MSSPISGMAFPVFDTSMIGSTTAVAGTGGTSAADSAGGAGFASVLASTVDQLQASQATADSLATQAATGDLKDVHSYMIASNEAKLATEMVVTIKNKAVEAFNEIMRMPV